MHLSHQNVTKLIQISRKNEPKQLLNHEKKLHRSFVERWVHRRLKSGKQKDLRCFCSNTQRFHNKAELLKLSSLLPWFILFPPILTTWFWSLFDLLVSQFYWITFRFSSPDERAAHQGARQAQRILSAINPSGSSQLLHPLCHSMKSHTSFERQTERHQNKQSNTDIFITAFKSATIFPISKAP